MSDGKTDNVAAVIEDLPETGPQFLRRVMMGGIWCKIHVKAIDQEAARDLAERRLRLTVDIINFYADIAVRRSRVFLPGDAGPSIRRTVHVLDGSAPDVAGKRVGPLREFSFAAVPEAMRRLLQFEKVSSWLANPTPSKLEDRILSALQWAGRAGAEDRREQAFLLYAIALESLLLGGSRTEITEKFALRGAHLLSSDLNARKNAYKELKALYDIRSEIVHSGSLEVTEDELSRIAAMAHGALVCVLNLAPFSAMTDESELEEWFKDQLLGAGQIPPAEPQA